MRRSPARWSRSARPLLAAVRVRVRATARGAARRLHRDDGLERAREPDGGALRARRPGVRREQERDHQRLRRPRRHDADAVRRPAHARCTTSGTAGCSGMALDPRLHDRAARTSTCSTPTTRRRTARMQPRWGDACPTPPGADRRRLRDHRPALAAERHRRRDRADRGLLPAVPEPLDRLDRVRARRHAVRAAPATARRSTAPTTARTAARSTRAATRRARRSRRRPRRAARCARSPSGARPARPVTLDGAILRVNPDTGAAAAGNPAIARRRPEPPPDRRLRLPQPVPLHVPARARARSGPATSAGTRTRRSTARQNVAQVRNYGWPCYEGAPRMGAYDTLNLDSCETLYAEGAGAVTAPYFAYNHAEKVVAGRELHDRLVVDLRPAFYTGDAFPAAYKDALFFSDYSRNCIWVVLQGRRRAAGHDARARRSPRSANGPVWLTAGPGRRALLRRPRRAARSAGSRPTTARRRRASSPTPRRGVAPLTVALRRHDARPTPRARR